MRIPRKIKKKLKRNAGLTVRHKNKCVLYDSYDQCWWVFEYYAPYDDNV